MLICSWDLTLVHMAIFSHGRAWYQHICRMMYSYGQSWRRQDTMSLHCDMMCSDDIPRAISWIQATWSIPWANSQIHVKIESMFPSLVIWNENTHIMKNVEYELHSWLPCSCYSELHAYDREAKNFVGTYCGSNDRRYSGHRLVHVRLSCLYFRNAASSPVCLDFLKY